MHAGNAPGAPRRDPHGGAAGVVLYELSLIVVALFVALLALAALATRPSAADVDRRVVVVTPGPPGHSRIPPGQLKKQGYVRVVTMTPSVAERYRLRYQQGVLVTEVVAVDGPGTTVLLQRWDVIVAVEGDAVTTAVELRTRLARVGGTWVKLTVWRSGRLLTLMVPVDVFDFEE